MPAVQRKPLYDPNAPENRWPKRVYPNGVKVGVTVNNQEEYDAVMGVAPKAAEPTPPARIEPATVSADEPADRVSPPSVPDPLPDDKAELIEIAASLGLAVDKRTGPDKIKAAILEQVKAA